MNSSRASKTLSAMQQEIRNALLVIEANNR
jgi:hypothetical protein